MSSITSTTLSADALPSATAKLTLNGNTEQQPEQQSTHSQRKKWWSETAKEGDVYPYQWAMPTHGVYTLNPERHF